MPSTKKVNFKARVTTAIRGDAREERKEEGQLERLTRATALLAACLAHTNSWTEMERRWFLDGIEYGKDSL